MSNNIDLFDSYSLIAIVEEVPSKTTFFRDRYFPTTAADVFASDKVLVEYRKRGKKMAPFVAPRIGDIAVDREGYSVYEFTPAKIAPSRALTVDDLAKRGFGEALFANTTPAKRAEKLLERDFTDLDERIANREEWMAVQTMMNNACTIQEYADADTPVGDPKYIHFHDGTSDHAYTVANKWDSANGNALADIKTMCRLLSARGLNASDLVLGTDAADYILSDERIRDMLNITSGIAFGKVDETIEYPGVVNMGTLNVGGFKLTLFEVSDAYEDDEGDRVPYFPAKSAMVTYPKCGHTAYGQVTQIASGSKEYETVAAPRVPKFVVDEQNDARSLRLTARPLTIPNNYCPYIYAANVVD